MLGSEQGLVGGFQGFGLPGPARLGLTCLLAGSELGWGPRMPEASPPQELRPQQLLEFKNKAVSSADISVSGLKGHRSSPGAPGGPVGRQGPPSLQPRGLGGQGTVPPPSSFPSSLSLLPSTLPPSPPPQTPLFLRLCQACPGLGGHCGGGVPVAPALADLSRGA